MCPRRLARASLILLFLVLGCRASTGAGKVQDQSELVEPRRVIVEVLNPGRRVGAARTATVQLRQEGLDVVYFGNLTDTVLAKRERHLVYVRRGDTTGIGRVIAAMGDAEVVDRADATRLVDLTVILGKGIPVPRSP